jgi:hypothetical protein
MTEEQATDATTDVPQAPPGEHSEEAPHESAGELADEPTGEVEGEPVEAPAEEPLRTGVERVDAVVDAVSGLAERPVDEHVAVFEQAHDELRRTLDSPPDDAGDPR